MIDPENSLGRAKATRARRRFFWYELSFVMVLAAAAGWFAAEVSYVPWLSVSIIWLPPLAGVAYWIWFRISARKELEKHCRVEQALSEHRRKETAARFAAAKASGVFDKWQSE